MQTREFLTDVGAIRVTQAWFVLAVLLTSASVYLLAGISWSLLWAGLCAFLIGSLSLLAYRVTRSTSFADKLAAHAQHE